jgi:hypothetical protein
MRSTLPWIESFNAKPEIPWRPERAKRKPGHLQIAIGHQITISDPFAAKRRWKDRLRIIEGGATTSIHANDHDISRLTKAVEHGSRPGRMTSSFNPEPAATAVERTAKF